MYINPFSIKLHKDDPQLALDAQLIGWVYESHAWVVADEDNQGHKMCKWCGATSTVDMVMVVDEGHSEICPDNPVISRLVMESRLSMPR
jgi:hypothetical protein